MTDEPTPLTGEQAIEMLRGGPQGVAEWKAYRMAGGEVPDLSGADLSGADLSGANLTQARLRSANLNGTQFRGANLGRANLRNARLSSADLRAADLSRANLRNTTLSWANLRGANLSGARLWKATLKHTETGQAIFTESSWGETTIACSLSDALGLETARHKAPSHISTRALLSFKSDLPEAFLRGCGLPDEEIAHYRSRVGSPIRYYSCFISYSTEDEAIASRLHNDFQAAGIRCWKWDHDARTGRSIWREINEAIRVFDKLVLIASKSSLKSVEVQDEIEEAVQKEKVLRKRREEGESDLDIDVLFPVRIDDYIFEEWEHERKAYVVKKVVADAREWQDPNVYASVLEKLIKDLKPE